MPSANQKRIEELESQLEVSERKRQQAEIMASTLTVTLQEIAHRDVSPDVEALKEFARQSITISEAEARLQQRDLNIAYLTIKRLRFPVAIRKQWSGSDVQQWIDQYAEVLKARALAHQEDKKETLQ